MSVVNGQIANQTTFNNAFMSRTAANTQTIAKVALENPDVISGANIANAQRAINKAFEGIGTTGEADANINVYANQNYILNGDSRKTAVEKLDAQLKTTQTDLDAAEVIIANHALRITDLESSDMSIGGNKTFTGNTVIGGNLTVNGTTTYVNSTDMQVADKNILVNKGGNDASSEGSGIDVQRTTDNAVLRFDSALASKWKIGLVSAMYEIIVSGIAQTISGIKDFVSGIKVDTINESTLNAGVTIDGVLIKDNLVDGRDVSADYTELDGRLDVLEAAPSGGGGGGTLLWEKTGDLSPQAEIVDGLKLETFSNGYDQELYALITVPSSYQAGQPIKLLSGAFFIAVTTGKILFRTETALIRDGSTVLGTYPNVHTSVNVEVDAPAVANTLKPIGDIDLTNGSGQINAVAVAAGDKLRVRLLRKNSSESSPANADAKLLINNFETRFTA